VNIRRHAHFNAQKRDRAVGFYPFFSVLKCLYFSSAANHLLWAELALFSRADPWLQVQSWANVCHTMNEVPKEPGLEPGMEPVDHGMEPGNPGMEPVDPGMDPVDPGKRTADCRVQLE
jgi:hypothetical protein